MPAAQPRPAARMEDKVILELRGSERMSIHLGRAFPTLIGHGQFAVCCKFAMPSSRFCAVICPSRPSPKSSSHLTKLSATAP